MKKIDVKTLIALMLTYFILLSFDNTAFASSQGHYYPGVIGLRDNIMPPPGSYFAMYDIYYHAGRYKDDDGNDLKSINAAGSAARDLEILNHPLRVTLDAAANVELKFKVDNIGHQIMYMWGAKRKILAAHYAFAIAPYFGYQRVRIDADANVSGILHIGRHLSVPVEAQRSKKVIEDKYGFGDLYVRPFWLDWSGKHYDLGVNYGFFAPVGAYDKDDIANIGMGFFSNEFQQTSAYYPWANKATALVLNTTYEVNSKKYDSAMRPGNDLTLEYGVSQYFSKQFEINISGYSQMQITDDAGWDASNKNKHRQIHGVGGSLNYWWVPGKFYMALRYTYEYGGDNTFQGHNGALNFIYKWGKPIEG